MTREDEVYIGRVVFGFGAEVEGVFLLRLMLLEIPRRETGRELEPRKWIARIHDRMGRWPEYRPHPTPRTESTSFASCWVLPKADFPAVVSISRTVPRQRSAPKPIAMFMARFPRVRICSRADGFPGFLRVSTGSGWRCGAGCSFSEGFPAPGRRYCHVFNWTDWPKWTRTGSRHPRPSGSRRGSLASRAEKKAHQAGHLSINQSAAGSML